MQAPAGGCPVCSPGLSNGNTGLNMRLARKTYLETDGSIADIPLDETRVKLRIKARVDTVFEGGYAKRDPHKEPHWQEVVVAQSQVPKIQALVETDHESLRVAKKHFEQRYKKWIGDNGGAESDVYNRKTCGESIERSFYEYTGRGILPLVAVEVVETGIAPPLMPPQIGVTGRGQSQNDAAILAELKALRERVESQDALLVEHGIKQVAPASKTKRRSN